MGTHPFVTALQTPHMHQRQPFIQTHNAIKYRTTIIHLQDRQMLPLWFALWRCQDSVGCEENGETVLPVL